MSNETEIIKVLAPYLAAFPQSRMDRAGLIIYARALKELSTAEIDAAMLHLMRTLRFFPSVAEIFESAAVIRARRCRMMASRMRGRRGKKPWTA